MAAKSYLDLKSEVWDAGRCSGCGACVAVCPADALYFDHGEMVEAPRVLAIANRYQTASPAEHATLCAPVPVTSPRKRWEAISDSSLQKPATISPENRAGAL